jgi:hypothetical protein
MKQHVKTGFVLAILISLPLVAVACGGTDRESIDQDWQGSIETSLTADREQAEWAVTLEYRRFERGITFHCAPPANSYVHRRLDLDEGYEESWDYTIHIDAGTNTFHLLHEAYANRRLEGDMCNDIFTWSAQESGEVDEEHQLNTTITLNQRNTLSCEADEVHPATEETREDVFQWWLISSQPFYDSGWKINTCTCNANAHQLTAEDVERFQSTGVCPPCIPGAMICTEEQGGQ